MSTTLGFLGDCDLFPCLGGGREQGREGGREGERGREREGGRERGIEKVSEWGREREREEGREKTLAITDNLINKLTIYNKPEVPQREIMHRSKANLNLICNYLIW